MNWGLRGAARSRQGKNGLTAREMVVEAVTGALDEAGMRPDQVGAVVMSNNGSYWDGQPSVAAQSWLYPIEFGDVQVFNIENACVGGGTAMHLGTTLLEAGRGPVLVVGVERMYIPDEPLNALGAQQSAKEVVMGIIEGGINQRLRPELKETYVNEFGSVFMGLNASWARSQVADRGHAPEQAAVAASKARHNAVLSRDAAPDERPVRRGSAPLADGRRSDSALDVRAAVGRCSRGAADARRSLRPTLDRGEHVHVG